MKRGGCRRRFLALPPCGERRGDQHAGHEDDRRQPPTSATSNQRGDHGAGHGEREHHRGGTRESGEDRGGHDRDRDDRSRWMHARTDEETERDPSENREQRDVPHAVPVDEPGDESHRVAGRKRRDGQKPERDGDDRHCRG